MEEEEKIKFYWQCSICEEKIYDFDGVHLIGENLSDLDFNGNILSCSNLECKECYHKLEKYNSHQKT